MRCHQEDLNRLGFDTTRMLLLSQPLTQVLSDVGLYGKINVTRYLIAPFLEPERTTLFLNGLLSR